MMEISEKIRVAAGIDGDPDAEPEVDLTDDPEAVVEPRVDADS